MISDGCDEVLARFFQRLEAIPTIRRLRIHTRLPVVIPERVTDTCQTIASIKIPVVVVLHVNHANEIDETLLRPFLNYGRYVARYSIKQ